MADFDTPYTSPDEDPFNVQPVVELVKPLRAVKHRRSSMLDKWISEQQAQPPVVANTADPPSPPCFNAGTFASSSNPYLAYPDLPRISQEAALLAEADTASIISYDLVDDDDIPHDTPLEGPSCEVLATPLSQCAHKSSRHSITPSFRNLSSPFRPSPPSASSSNMEAASRAFARLSIFPRTPRSSTDPSSDMTPPQQHNRSSSVSTLNSSSSHPKSKAIPSSTSPKWRPTVLGHFQQMSTSEVSVETSEAQYTPSRPSISSGDTCTTWHTAQTATTLDTNIPPTPSKISLFESIRLRSSRSPKMSKFSAASSSSSIQLANVPIVGNTCDVKEGPFSKRVPFQPLPNSNLHNRISDDDLDPLRTYRPNRPEASQPSYSSSGTLPRVKFASLNSRSHRKKKKLVVSGIGVTEIRKFENLKRWCESFGDVRQISRMPNGDLQIEFRDSEVADTVCRVRAKVFIAGVGSVQLSWISGSRR